jgi:hypothetical protein
MVGHDATQRLENVLPLVGCQDLPELTGLLSGRRRLSRARGGTQGGRDRRMTALLADGYSRVGYTSPLTGVVRLPLS